LFTWAVFSNTEVAQIFGLLFSAVKHFAQILTSSGVGYVQFGRFFSQTHLVTLPPGQGLGNLSGKTENGMIFADV
jgi:hypothetical protein